MESSVKNEKQYESNYYIWVILVHVLCQYEFIRFQKMQLCVEGISISLVKNKKPQMNRAWCTSFRWSVAHVFWRWSGWNRARCTTLTSESKSSRPQRGESHFATPRHLQLWPFSILQLCSGPLHPLLTWKMLTNLSDHFCNMLHRTTACHTICHILLCRVNIYPLVSVLLSIQLLLQDCPHSGWQSNVEVRGATGLVSCLGTGCS